MSSDEGRSGGGSGHSGSIDQPKAKFKAAIRPEAGERQRIANVHGRPKVYLKNAEHGRHMIPIGLSIAGITNPFDIPSDHSLGSRDWLQEKRGQLQRFILRISVLGGKVEILSKGVEAAFTEYEKYRLSKEVLDEMQDDLDQAAQARILIARVLSQAQQPSASIDFETEFRKLAQLLAVPGGNVEVHQVSPDTVLESERCFFKNASHFGQKIGREGGYYVNNSPIRDLCEALGEALLEYFSEGVPGVTFHKHEPTIKVLKSRKLEVVKSKKSALYGYQPQVGNAGEAGAPPKRPDASEQIPLKRLNSRYCDPRMINEDLINLREKISSLVTKVRWIKLKLAEDSLDAARKAELEKELQSLEEQLKVPKQQRSALVDADLLRDMYLLYDYPKLSEEFNPSLANQSSEVQAVCGHDEKFFFQQLFLRGFRSNDLDHLALAIARFIYFFFNAYPQAAIDFDWDVCIPLVDLSELENRIIAPFTQFVVSDWGIESDELTLLYLVKKLFNDLATKVPNAGVQQQFDVAASSGEDSIHTSDSDEEGRLSPVSMLLNIQNRFGKGDEGAPKPDSARRGR